MGGKEGSEKDLYLKGSGKAYGKEVNLDEELEVHGKTEKVWRLQVFKENGVIWLQQISGAHGENYEDETITCTGNKFEIVTPTYKDKGDWEKPISKITFELKECTEATGRKECEIKIVKNLI